jgi:hypothetical protein
MQTMGFLGGLSLGVGLMYLLDPEKGAERRDLVRGYMRDYGQQTGDFFDDTTRTLGRQAQAVLAKTRVPSRRQPGLGERLQMQAEALGLPLGLCLLGGVGLGAGLVALLEPQGGPKRRAWLRETARAYWRSMAPDHTPQQEWRKAWRFFQGHDTQRVDAHTQKPPQAQAWYAEPKDYDSYVLYSAPFATRDEAEAWARAKGKP